MEYNGADKDILFFLEKPKRTHFSADLWVRLSDIVFILRLRYQFVLHFVMFYRHQNLYLETPVRTVTLCNPCMYRSTPVSVRMIIKVQREMAECTNQLFYFYLLCVSLFSSTLTYVSWEINFCSEEVLLVISNINSVFVLISRNDPKRQKTCRLSFYMN